MKISKCWLSTTFLQFACVWALVLTSPEQVRAQTFSKSVGPNLPPSVPDAGWPSYGHDVGGTRYSTAAQINRDNVAQLKVAWTYRTGALDGVGDDLKRNAAFEAMRSLAKRFGSMSCLLAGRRRR